MARRIAWLGLSSPVIDVVAMDDLADAGEVGMLGELGADRGLVAEQEEAADRRGGARRSAAPATMTAGPASPPIASMAIRGPLLTMPVPRREAGPS